MAKTSSIVPLIVLFLVVGFLAVVGFVVYSIANDVSQQTRQKLERKNVSFSRGGMKVGVKEVTVEQQEDVTQSVLMKVWNNSSWPGYQSKLGWGQAKSASPVSTPGGEKRNPFSRSSSQVKPSLSRQGSGQTNVSRTTSAQVK